jgi:IclR family transcriptional regulator, pca regulon regulatory protein
MSDPSRKEIVNSLANGLKVLRLFGDHRSEFTITEVAQHAGLTPASARRVLLTLADLGYLAFERNRAHLTPKVLDLGYGYLSSQPFWHVAQPILERVSVELGHPSSAAALSLPDIVFLIRAPRQVGTLLVSVGTRFPAWAMALGRALLAELPEAKLNSYLKSVDLKPFTPFTIVDAKKICRRIAEVRKQGYALLDREYDVGVRAIAVPVRNRSGTAIASIDVAVDPHLHGVDLLIKTALPVLIGAANEIRNSLPG